MQKVNIKILEPGNMSVMTFEGSLLYNLKLAPIGSDNTSGFHQIRLIPLDKIKY